MKHGLVSSYSHGCRCAECRVASTEYHRARNVERKGSLTPDDPRHGTTNAYSNFGCRCVYCYLAQSDKNRRAYVARGRAR